MGVVDEAGNIFELLVAGMGYIPSCKIAQAALGALAPPKPKSNLVAKFVDNIGFFGTPQAAAADMADFKDRSARCGGVVNDEDNSPRTQYEFLGERYDHVSKTRALTNKSVEKLKRIKQLLDSIAGKKGKTTCRRFMAIMGSLLYAAEVLDIGLTSKTAALTLFASLSAEAGRLNSWDHKVIITQAAAADLVELTEHALRNVPVHVTRGNREPTSTREELHIWVDASAWGFGAVAVRSGHPVVQLSRQWTPEDHEEANSMYGTLQSSVFAEPLAVRRALCLIALGDCTPVVYSDHQPLVASASKRYSLQPAYNAAMDTLSQLGGRIEWIPGSANPADALSRGTAPLLAVTSIGFRAGG
jgi:hypothetical protein